MKSTEIGPNTNNCTIPNLPTAISGSPSMVLTNDKKILLCGGRNNLLQCLNLHQENWYHHSNLNEERSFATAIQMSKGTYLFGGINSPNTWEWLPNGSNKWKQGAGRISEGFNRGCGVGISNKEVLLIGGQGTKQRIFKIDVESNHQEEVGQLNQGRYFHSCTKFLNQIVVTGGRKSWNEVLKSTEILDMNTLVPRVGHNMNEGRFGHGLIVSHYNKQQTLLAVGGVDYQNKWNWKDTIEVWNPDDGTWSLSNALKHIEAKNAFGFSSIPTRLVCSPKSNSTDPVENDDDVLFLNVYIKFFAERRKSF